MPVVELTDTEWQTALAFMAYAPARECMPLLNKIGAQLMAQQQTPRLDAGIPSQGNSHQEVKS